MKWMVAAILIVVCVIGIMQYNEYCRQASERDQKSYDDCIRTFSDAPGICDVYESSPYHKNPRRVAESKPYVPPPDPPTSPEDCKALVAAFGQARVNAKAKKDPTLKPCYVAPKAKKSEVRSP